MFQSVVRMQTVCSYSYGIAYWCLYLLFYLLLYTKCYWWVTTYIFTKYIHTYVYMYQVYPNITVLHSEDYIVAIYFGFFIIFITSCWVSHFFFSLKLQKMELLCVFSIFCLVISWTICPIDKIGLAILSTGLHLLILFH